MNAGNSIKCERANWKFGGDVTKKFEEHAEMSIPFYREGHELITYLSDFFCGDGSICYDLGASTGLLLKRLAGHNSHKDVKFVGIDIEPEMAELAKKNCAGWGNVEIYCDDILTFAYEPADMIIAYYTIQFVKPKVRQDIFNKIYENLNWGGAFILFEKVRAPDARFQDIMASLYDDYKAGQGFSNDEIMNKARSLRGVLEPFSTQGNYDLLKRAGFVDIMTVMKYVSFEGFLAVK